MAIVFDNFRELLGEWNNLPSAWIFVRESEVNDLKNARFYIVESPNEYIEDSGYAIPEEIYEKDDLTVPLVETETFEDIIVVKLENNQELSFTDDLEEFVEAVYYYYKHDAFME